MKGGQMETTRISAGLTTTVNLGNFENVKFEITVEDFVRESDASTSDAIDRIFSLVEKKIVEKVEQYNAK